ncbi:DUF6292 family protein [Actinomadura scrupuli]|uniref:DUF6292 family protein n=1 Tax=Actinomadura scrupuli TaxID=559629 RepID=UPI003D991A1C
MSQEKRPLPHPDPEVDEARGYITDAVDALDALGVRVERSWLDPKGPVDATIVTDSFALVWDEWRGWVRGDFVSGRQGERTVLRNLTELGGGLLLDPRELAVLARDGRTVAPAGRRAADARDGLFDGLRRY